MADAVKGDSSQPRRYDASGRREKALLTRRSVVAAARALIEERGYSATTIADVAARASVSSESIYKGFGTKAALVKEVFDVTIAGDDEPLAVADRPDAKEVQAEPDVRAKLRLYAASAASRAERSARIQLAIRDGAAVDPAVDELWRTLQTQRLTGMTMLAHHLVETGQLRPGIQVDEVRDVLWMCISVEVYDLLVLQRGWSLDAYATWLAGTIIASVTGADAITSPLSESARS